MSVVSESNSASLFQIDDNSHLVSWRGTEAAYIPENSNNGAPVYFTDPNTADTEFMTCSIDGDIGTSQAAVTCSASPDDTWFYCPTENWVVTVPAGSQPQSVSNEFGPGCEQVALIASYALKK